MKHCTACKSIHKEEADTCTECGRVLECIKADSIVCIANIKGRTVSILEPVLKDKGIPCGFENTEGNVYNTYNTKVSAESNYRLLVPFEFYTETFDICLAMDIVKDEDRLLEPSESESEDTSSKTYNEKFEDKTGVKHSTWQFVWVILFIIVACLAVWGIDYIAGLINPYFTGGFGSVGATQAVTSLIGFTHFW